MKVSKNPRLSFRHGAPWTMKASSARDPTYFRAPLSPIRVAKAEGSLGDWLAVAPLTCPASLCACPPTSNSSSPATPPAPASQPRQPAVRVCTSTWGIRRDEETLRMSSDAWPLPAARHDGMTHQPRRDGRTSRPVLLAKCINDTYMYVCMYATHTKRSVWLVGLTKPTEVESGTLVHYRLDSIPDVMVTDDEWMRIHTHVAVAWPDVVFQLVVQE